MPKDVKHIVSFSGGKDSTAMLLMMIEKDMKIDRIINIDTTKEFPGMYAHIEKVNEYIKPYNLNIETVKIDFDYWFGCHIKTKGKMKGEKGYGWPDSRSRWCTALKREVTKRNINKNTIQYHGIASDEGSRTHKNKSRDIRYPLIEFGMTEQDCLNYCYSKGFDWGGLYTDFNRVSCYCCPLSSLGELEILYNKYPDLWSNMKEMDKLSFRRFRSDYTIDQLEDRFKHCSLWR